MSESDPQGSGGVSGEAAVTDSIQLIGLGECGEDFGFGDSVAEGGEGFAG